MTLELRGISITFTRYRGLRHGGQTTVLNDVSLALGPGEMVGLAGASGAGKSLIGSALMGALGANARMTGDIILDGMRLEGRRLATARGCEIALAPQGLDALDPLRTVGRQIATMLRLSGCSRGEAEARVQPALARYGLPRQTKNAYPHELSGGMAKRVLLAAVTAGGARFLVVDEPTAGLDPAAASNVMTHLRELARSGRGVLCISHDLPLLARSASRIGVLEHGRLVEMAPAAAFRGKGEALTHDFSRRLWAAQTINGMELST